MAISRFYNCYRGIIIMSSVIASHIPADITVQKLYVFFSFCGDIHSINPQDTKDDKFKTYQVVFTSPKALSTALLLNEAQLEGVSITVVEDSSESVGGAKSEKYTDETKTGDSSYDDISQEEKPKYAIMAQMLASGYTVGDQVIDKLLKVDKEHGYSAKFKSFLTDLDEKYIHTGEPDSAASRAQNTLNSLSSQVTQSTYSARLAHYFDRASQLPYGVKVHEFYKNLAKDVQEIHTEAKRLNELKKQDQLEDNVASANAAGAINTAN